MRPITKQYRSTSVERAIALLTLLRSAGELGLADVALRTRMLKPSAFRTLKELCEEGLVFKHPDSGKYRLSFRAIGLGDAEKRSGALVAEARPVMLQIHAYFGETVYLSIRRGDYRIDIDKIDGRNEQRRIVELRVPKPFFHGAASKVFAASMTEIEIRQILRRTAPRNFDVNTFIKDIASVRRKGFSVNTVTGGAVSAAISDKSEQLIASLTVSVPLSVYPSVKSDLQHSIVKGAKDISKALMRHEFSTL